MESRTDILIIGAGLAGLSTAFHLGGRCAVRLVEREDRPGGLVVTDEVRGFRFDRTGHLLHLRNPSIRRWILPLMARRLRLVQRRSRIWSHGRYTLYPFQSNTYGLPPAVAEECLLEYLRVREEPPGIRIRSFLDFINVHFGRGFARHFMIPYNRKIWGVHPRDMTSAWCDRFVPIPHLEDVIAGAVGARDRELGYNVEFHYPEGGIGELSDALARAVGRTVPIEYGTGVTSIDRRGRAARLDSGEVVRYEHLVSTLPLPRLVGLLAAPPAPVRRAASRLRCTRLRYLDVALKIPAGTPYHWTYVPSPRIPFYRIGAYSNFSPALVPKGCGSLYVELASRRPIDMKRVMPAVTAHLTQMHLIRKASDILFAIPRGIDYAYVVYDHHYVKSTRQVRGFIEKEGIHSIGRYGGWNYSAMEDALVMGKETAERILAGGG